MNKKYFEELYNRCIYMRRKNMIIVPLIKQNLY